MGAPATPTVELEGPTGRRVTVAPRSPDDRMGELADALGLDPRRRLELDGRPVGRHETLRRAGLSRGSRLTSAPPGEPNRAGEPDPPATTAPVVVVVGEAGPASGTAVALPAGRYVVGRSPAVPVSIADPALEPHHGLLDVDADGTVQFLQLTGRVPAWVAGEPVHGAALVPDGATVVVGASRLRVGRPVGSVPGAAAVTVSSADPWRRSLHRTPRARPRWDPAPVARPAPRGPSRSSSGVGVTAAICTLIGSVVIAAVMRSPLFLLLGAVGVLASLGMWIASRVGSWRNLRRDAARRDRELVAFAAAVTGQRAARWQHHLETTPTVSQAVAAATTTRADVWARRAADSDAYRVTLGWGPVRWDVAVDDDHGDPLDPDLLTVLAAAEQFDDAPVPAELGQGAALGVTGPGAAAVVRSIVIQLATWTGPADWRLVVVADDPAAWDWCRWLPHSSAVLPADDAEQQAAALARLDDGASRHVVVVSDRPDLLAQRTGALRRFLSAAPSVAVVVRVAAGEAVPAMCRSVLEIGSIGLARWSTDTSLPTPSTPVHAAGVAVGDAVRVARALAALHDPEDPSAAADALATSVTLGALCAQHGGGPIDDAIAVAAAWRSGGHDPAPVALLGVTADGVVEIDLVRDGPHALVAGTTGSGKSELLRTLVVSLAAQCSPDHLTFVLVDYKGGSTFDACADLPHTVGVVTDLDDRLAERALVSLEAEVRRRERLLRAVGAADLIEYRTDPQRPALARLVVVIDEFAALAAELPAFLSSLVGVAQRGRSLGVHLVLATQRPAGVVDDHIRANTNLRLALRLQDAGDARDVVGDDEPVRFPRSTPGRTMLRLGPTETVVFQSARSTGPVTPRDDERLRVVSAPDVDGTDATTELAVLVRSIRHAAALSDIAPPHRPWLPPLPAPLAEPTGPGAVGIVDVPAEQRRDDLRWTPTNGNLALVGAFGAGTTTALISVLLAACDGASPQERHVYLVDARGDERLDGLGRLPHCAGVVRPHERERLARLLQRLVEQLDRRRAGGGREGGPEIILGVDGVSALRATLDAPTDGTRWEHLLRIVAEGAAVGIVSVVTAERPGAVPAAVLAACAERWVFHLDDASEASACGIRPVAVPAAIPGRIVIASTGHEAQLAVRGVEPSLDEPSPSRGPTPIGVLPTIVDAAALPAGTLTATGELGLAVGLDFETLAVAHLEVPDGEHVLVAGPPRSGRTTALARLAESWLDARRGESVVAVGDARRSARGAFVDTPAVDAAAAVAAVDELAGRPCLLVVDDAERVADAGGHLAALVAERRPGVLVIAAGRPDGLRGLYGHWTAVVRRSRLGLLLSSCSDTDGDVLGELLPRHAPLPSRPGLAWMVGGGRRTLVQVAMRPTRRDEAGAPGVSSR